MLSKIFKCVYKTLLITPRAVFCTGEILLRDKLLKNAFAKLQTQ